MDTIKWPFLKQNWGMQVVRSEGAYLYTSDGRKILDAAGGAIVSNIGYGREEVAEAGLYNDIWQAFAVLLPVRSVGVMGDQRTYAWPIVLRCVSSEDGMTADWSRLSYQLLEKISNRIVNEVQGVNRVVLDITSKPPGTIEWE